MKFVIHSEDSSSTKSTSINASFAFISPKKLGKAVHRNRCRRRLKEAFRLTQASLLPSVEEAGWRISGVFIATNIEATTSDLQQEFLKLYKEIEAFVLKRQATPSSNKSIDAPEKAASDVESQKSV